MSRAWSAAICKDTFLRVSCPAPEPAEFLDVWCLHGAGESGIPFFPLLGSEVARRHRVVVPDLPGFGASPPFMESAATFECMVAHVQQLIVGFSGARRLALIGHSIGAMIATELAGRLGEQVQSMISVEGNLTPADAYLTGIAAAHTDAITYQRLWLDRIGAEAAAGEPGAGGPRQRHFAGPQVPGSWREPLLPSPPPTLLLGLRGCLARKHYYGDRGLSGGGGTLVGTQFHVGLPRPGHWPMVEVSRLVPPGNLQTFGARRGRLPACRSRSSTRSVLAALPYGQGVSGREFIGVRWVALYVGTCPNISDSDLNRCSRPMAHCAFLPVIQDRGGPVEGLRLRREVATKRRKPINALNSKEMNGRP
jgi:pimeloyl-ACP methyl ester carboxylesterase